MKTRNGFFKVLICLSLMIMSSWNLYSSDSTYFKSSFNDVLPNSIIVLLNDSLSNYIIPSENMFLDEWKFYDCIIKPMYAHSDFNGDTKEDHAFILISNNNTSMLFVVILSEKDDNSFTIHRIRSFNKSCELIDVFISVDKKGFWEAINSGIYVKFDGIRVDWSFASLSFSYYWKNSSFHQFTSD